MGRVRLTCFEACTCEGGIMDGHHSAFASVHIVREFVVSQAKACGVRLELLGDAPAAAPHSPRHVARHKTGTTNSRSTPGVRFVLDQLVVSASPKQVAR